MALHNLLLLLLLQTAPPQIFPNAMPGTTPHTIQYTVPAAEIETIGTIATSHGWVLSASNDTQGLVTSAGVTLSFTYSNNLLTIVIVDKPWNISEGEIFGEIYGWFYTPVGGYGTPYRPPIIPPSCTVARTC